MSIPKNWTTWTATADRIYHAGRNHNVITKALDEAARLWAKDSDTTAAKQKLCGLPQQHPVYAIASAAFPAILTEHAATGIITYPVMLKLQVASAKTVFSLSGAFWQSWNSKLDDEVAHDRLLLGDDHPVGTLYAAKNTDPIELTTDSMRQSWENGYRACFRELSKRLSVSPNETPNQTSRRSPKFWLTYEAWLVIQTDPAVAHRLRGQKAIAVIIEILETLGVKTQGDYLTFPGEKTRIKRASLESQLPTWVKDFQDLAKT